ncbi:MAG: hypothetical protein WCE64_05700 [Bacteroidales bacterium]
MTRKLVGYALFLLPVIIVTLLIFRQRSPFGGDSSFTINPGAEITRIEFSDRSNSLSLEKKGNEWLVNSKYETRRNSVLFVLEVLRKMALKSPVSPELFKKEITDRGIKPVRVRVFSERKLLKSFFVYKTQSNIYGNIMKLREGSKPFIIYVPGDEVNIGSVFTMNELYWQPFVVFSLLPSEIASVNVENVNEPVSSFSISNEAGGPVLSGSGKPLTGWDSGRVERYLSYFSHVPFESWAFDLSSAERAQIDRQQPVYTISVRMTSGATLTLDLLERFTGENGTRKKDTDRLWARTNARDEIFIIRYLDIDPLLKKRSYFYP